MSCEPFEVDMRVEAVSDFKVEETLPSPGYDGTFEIKAGDTGRVVQKQVVGNTHWLRVRWDRLRRTLNLDHNNMPHVRPAG